MRTRVELRFSASIGLLLLLAACPAPSPSQPATQPGAVAPAGTPAVAPASASTSAARPHDERKDDPRPRPSDPGVVTQLEDGSYTFAGIRGEIAKAQHRDIMVKAWVQRVHAAPPCPIERGCAAGKEPHAWVTETPDPGAPAMKLVDYAFAIPEREAKRWRGQPTIALEVGKQYIFSVELRPAGDASDVADDAVLHFRGYRPVDQHHGWTYPPGAPWHPITLAAAAERDAVRRAR